MTSAPDPTPVGPGSAPSLYGVCVPTLDGECACGRGATLRGDEPLGVAYLHLATTAPPGGGPCPSVAKWANKTGKALMDRVDDCVTAAQVAWDAYVAIAGPVRLGVPPPHKQEPLFVFKRVDPEGRMVLVPTSSASQVPRRKEAATLALALALSRACDALAESGAVRQWMVEAMHEVGSYVGIMGGLVDIAEGNAYHAPFGCKDEDLEERHEVTELARRNARDRYGSKSLGTLSKKVAQDARAQRAATVARLTSNPRISWAAATARVLAKWKDTLRHTRRALKASPVFDLAERARVGVLPSPRVDLDTERLGLQLETLFHHRTHDWREVEESAKAESGGDPVLYLDLCMKKYEDFSRWITTHSFLRGLWAAVAKLEDTKVFQWQGDTLDSAVLLHVPYKNVSAMKLAMVATAKRGLSSLKGFDDSRTDVCPCDGGFLLQLYKKYEKPW